VSQTIDDVTTIAQNVVTDHGVSQAVDQSVEVVIFLAERIQHVMRHLATDNDTRANYCSYLSVFSFE